MLNSILLVDIVLCSKFPGTKFIGNKCFDMRLSVARQAIMQQTVVSLGGTETILAGMRNHGEDPKVIELGIYPY